MKTLKHILILILSLSTFAFVQAKQPTKEKETSVTSSMVNKFKYIYDSDEVFRRTFNSWYGCRSWEDSYKKMNDILENPNLAKTIIYNIFSFYGTGDIGYVHFTRNYGFTDQEYNIALKIYQEHKKALEEEEAEEQRKQIIKETAEEEALLNRWLQNGPDVFENLKDSHLIAPKVSINLNHISDKLANTSTYRPLSDLSPSKITFYVLPDKSINNLVVEGSLSSSIDIDDIIIDEPAKYKFEHLDNVFPVPAKYSIQIIEDADLLGYIECRIKYNNKKELWEIEILDKEKDPQSYQWIYENTEFKDNLTPSAKDAIATAIIEAINADDSLKSKLIRGKHKLNLSVFNHFIQYKSNKAYLQPFVDSIIVDKK